MSKIKKKLDPDINIEVNNHLLIMYLACILTLKLNEMQWDVVRPVFYNIFGSNNKLTEVF